MDLTADAYRALAASSPWRWRTAHFTYTDADTRAEAWVRRPGQQLVRVAGHDDHRTDDRNRIRDGSVSSVLMSPMPRRYGVLPGRRPRIRRRWPHDVDPARRPDGLVAVRPHDPDIEWDDPVYQHYTWVAMLDPVELSHHTDVVRLREGDRLGRRTWWGRVSAQDGYDPRCSCCPLLWSEASDRSEANAEGDASWSPAPGTTYPEAYDVALDVQTGIVVERSPIGPTSQPDGHALELHEVDVDLSPVLGP